MSNRNGGDPRKTLNMRELTIFNEFGYKNRDQDLIDLAYQSYCEEYNLRERTDEKWLEWLEHELDSQLDDRYNGLSVCTKCGVKMVEEANLLETWDRVEYELICNACGKTSYCFKLKSYDERLEWAKNNP